MKKRVLPYLLIMPLILIQPITDASNQDRRYPPIDYSLEIPLQSSLSRKFKTGVSRQGGFMTMILRRDLKITDQEAANGITAIDVWARGEEAGISVRLSVIYNDLSNQEWWKEKKEKILGTYFVPEGQSIYPAELADFGIEPFEMKAASVKPVVLKPGIDFKVNNKTSSLEVISAEKSLDRYQLLLKNISGKDISGYRIIAGGGIGTGSMMPGGNLIPAGSSHYKEGLIGSDIEDEGITIEIVFFSDGTFDGDKETGERTITNSAVTRKGMKIQAPHVLQKIESLLLVDDSELEAAFVKLESELWKIPEAIDKLSAIELLRVDFPDRDEKEISRLYERLKGGLYDARNYALSPMGGMIRDLKQMEEHDPSSVTKEYRARYIRDRLNDLKEQFEKIISDQQ